jgi:hypothetical protein
VSHGNRLTADHGLVHRALTLDDDTIHRHLLARAHAQPVTHLYLLEGHVGFGSVGVQSSGGFGRQAEQRADSRARTVSRAQLHYLTE